MNDRSDVAPEERLIHDFSPFGADLAQGQPLNGREKCEELDQKL